MSNQARAVVELLAALEDALLRHGRSEAVNTLLMKMRALRAAQPQVQSLSPHMPDHLCIDFRGVYDHLPSSLFTVSSALKEAEPHLYWKADDASGAGYYQSGEDIGESYAQGNMCCPLIGPTGSFIESEDLLFVLFFLKPKTLYRDHCHKASEVYFNLTGPAGFRLDDRDWSDRPGDSVIWNRSWSVHATRVYQMPFLAAVAWIADIDSTIQVTARDDWHVLETELQQC